MEILVKNEGQKVGTKKFQNISFIISGEQENRMI
jgi:hypothetical protein